MKRRCFHGTLPLSLVAFHYWTIWESQSQSKSLLSTFLSYLTMFLFLCHRFKEPSLPQSVCAIQPCSCRNYFKLFLMTSLRTFDLSDDATLFANCYSIHLYMSDFSLFNEKLFHRVRLNLPVVCVHTHTRVHGLVDVHVLSDMESIHLADQREIFLQCTVLCLHFSIGSVHYFWYLVIILSRVACARTRTCAGHRVLDSLDLDILCCVWSYTGVCVCEMH